MSRLDDKRIRDLEALGRDGYAIKLQPEELESMATEIRERRAADLAPEQATWVRAFVEAGKSECMARMGAIPPTARDALAVLDRLLAQGREK